MTKCEIKTGDPRQWKSVHSQLKYEATQMHTKQSSLSRLEAKKGLPKFAVPGLFTVKKALFTQLPKRRFQKETYYLRVYEGRPVVSEIMKKSKKNSSTDDVTITGGSGGSGASKHISQQSSSNNISSPVPSLTHNNSSGTLKKPFDKSQIKKKIPTKMPAKSLPARPVVKSYPCFSDTDSVHFENLPSSLVMVCHSLCESMCVVVC